MSPAHVALCSTCGRILDATGDCLACLVRVGFDQPLAELVSPVFGDFEIARREDGSFWELGRGAMGVTYRADDKVLNRSVALKVIDAPEAAGDGQMVRDRFLREARAAAAFRHPNVAGVFHFGASPGGDGCYYAMELVEGETLEALVRRNGPLQVKAALEIATQVTRALVAAAGEGLVHRDLKPGNIMLKRTDDEGAELEVKVIDFGLAKAIADTGIERDLTQGGFVGTPAFASPEQFRGAPADARSDIYSLGVTLWYALTGEVPHEGTSIEEIRRGQTEVALPVEQLIARKIPAPAIQLLRRILAVDPIQRPASARELMDIVEACRVRLGFIPPPGSKVWRTGQKFAAAFVGLAVIGAVAFLALRLQEHNATAPPPAPAKSIAVLPFENLSVEGENAFLADGMQDDLLTALARIPGLKVISRSSVVTYRAGAPRNLREIAHALGVAHILEGSVRRAGNKLRVTSQLVDAQNDAQIWAHTYDRDVQDLFSIQSEIALQIATQLEANLPSSVKSVIEKSATQDMAAYELYVRAKSLLTLPFVEAKTHLEAVRLLDQATTRDPDFFPAYCTLVYLHTWLYRWWDPTPERRSLAERSLAAAARLRPDAGETHLARAQHFFMQLDYSNARREVALAQKALPPQSDIFGLLAAMDRRQGYSEDAALNREKALELDPRNGFHFWQLFWTYRGIRKYAEASSTLDRALALDPNDVGFRVHQGLLQLHWRADTRPLHETFAVLANDDPAGAARFSYHWLDLALSERDPVAAARALPGMEEGFNYDALWFPGAWFRGLAARALGDEVGATNAFAAARVEVEKRVRDKPDDGPSLCVLGLIDAGLGRKEEAIRAGRRANDLLPTARDGLNGAHIMAYLSVIYAWTGEKDLAIAQIAATLRAPTTVMSYGQLRLHPFWDSLRGDPRFEKLVADLAPKPGE